MRRDSSLPILLVLLLVAACTAGNGPSQAAPGDQTTTADTTITTAAPTTTIASTTESPVASTTTATVTTTSATKTQTTTTITPVADLEAGLFCRDLFPLGYDYAETVSYWVKEGSPDRMDADRNGIPCETVYAEVDVVAFWGSPLPTHTASPSLTLDNLERYVSEQWLDAGGYPIDWDCQIDMGVDLSAGTVMSCRPTVIGDGEHPVLTVLILDNSGTVAVAEAGLFHLQLNSGALVAQLGSGKFCRDVLDPEIGLPEYVADLAVRYFGSVLYWFMEGRPDRMDADGNGIPCETLVDAGVVSDFWRGGWIGDTQL